MSDLPASLNAARAAAYRRQRHEPTFDQYAAHPERYPTIQRQPARPTFPANAMVLRRLPQQEPPAPMAWEDTVPYGPGGVVTRPPPAPAMRAERLPFSVLTGGDPRGHIEDYLWPQLPPQMPPDTPPSLPPRHGLEPPDAAQAGVYADLAGDWRGALGRVRAQERNEAIPRRVMPHSAAMDYAYAAPAMRRRHQPSRGGADR